MSASRTSSLMKRLGRFSLITSTALASIVAGSIASAIELNPVDNPTVQEGMKALGPVAGAIIAVLLMCCVATISCIVWMQRRADKVYGYRLAERDKLMEALHAASAGQQAQAAATHQRNALQEELAETIEALTNSIQLFIERSTIHHTHMVGDQGKQHVVIESISQAMRDVAMHTSGLKDNVAALALGLPGMTSDLKSHMDRLTRDVQDAASRRRS